MLNQLDHILNIIISLLAIHLVSGCGQSIPDISSDSRGYLVYVFAKRTEVMIDFSKSDGISRGTRLDVFRMNVPDMDEPVKLGEITVNNVGDRMSKARVTAITSSLKMERGDRVFPQPIIIISDDSWKAHFGAEDGWKSEISLPNERNWENCLSLENFQRNPSVNLLIEDTDAKPVWHPSVRSQSREIFFRKVFQVDARIVSAKIDVVCNDRANIYANDSWVGEVRGFEKGQENSPKIESFNIRSFMRNGKNLIAIQVYRDQRSAVPPMLIAAISLQTTFY